MEFLITALVLFAVALVAIPVLVWLFKSMGRVVRIIFEVAIALLIIGGIAFLVVHFVA